MFVAEGNIDETMVHECGQRVGDGNLLSTTLGTGGDEDTAHLALESALAPEGAGGVPECLPLNGEVAVTGGNTEEERVKVDKVIREEDRVVWSRGRLDELQDVVGEGLLDLVNGGIATSTADTRLDGLGHLCDVAVKGVDDDSDSRGRHIGLRNGFKNWGENGGRNWKVLLNRLSFCI